MTSGAEVWMPPCSLGRIHRLATKTTGNRRCMGNDCSLRSLAQQGGNLHASPDSNHLPGGSLADLGDYGLWSALFADSASNTAPLPGVFTGVEEHQSDHAENESYGSAAS